MKHLAFLIVMSLGLICGCRQPRAPQREPRVVEVNLVPLSLPPVGTFESACARCHGPQGSFYGEGFAEPAEVELAVIVREMMEGPAFLSPSDADVEAMVAYHRALAAEEPFLCVTAYEPATATTAGRLQGEATPGAEVSFLMNSVSPMSEAGEQGWWELSPLIPGVNIVAITRDGSEMKMTVLDVAKRQWSHALP